MIPETDKLFESGYPNLLESVDFEHSKVDWQPEGQNIEHI